MHCLYLSFVTLGWVIIGDFKFKRTEDLHLKIVINPYKPASGNISLPDNVKEDLRLH